MKSTLAITAGCVLSALAVGDTVYRIAPRSGRTYATAISVKGGVGDVSQLTDQDDTAMNGDLDDLFAQENRDGIDADELSSIRTLALIARPHDSSWGQDFFKDADGKVGGVSQYTMAGTTAAWDATLGASMATSATSGPMSYFSSTGGSSTGLIDMFALSEPGPGSRGGFAGGGADGGAAANNLRNHPAILLSSLSPTPVVAVPEPTTLSLLGLAGLGCLTRRRRAR